MARPAILKVEIISDARKAQAGFDGVEKRTQKFGKAMKIAGGAALVAGGAVKIAYDKMIKPAGDLEQSIGAIDTVFKGNADQMHKWAKGAATDVGLTRNEFNELGTLIGTQLKNGGTSMDQLAPKTNKLVGLGADLSSMFGGTTKEAVEALSSALKGERDPIEKYGVSLKQASIDAEAARLGYDKVGGSLSEQAQQAATLSLIYKQTGDAQGNFAKESDTLQGKQQRLIAQWENAKATLGTALLPIATKFFGFLADKALPAITNLINGFNGMGSGGDFLEKLGLAKLQPAFDALVAGFQTAIPVIKTFVTETIVPMMQTLGAKLSPLLQTLGATVVPAVVSAFQTLGPPLLQVVQAVHGLVGAIAERLTPVIKWLAPFVKQAFTGMAEIISPVLSFIAGLIKTVTAVIRGDWSAAWNGIKQMFVAVWNFLKAIVVNAVRAIKLILSTAWSAIKAVAGAAWNGIKALISAAWNGIKSTVTRNINAVKAGLSAAWNVIKSTASNTWNAIKSAITSRVTALKNTLSAAWNVIKSTASSAWNGIKDLISRAVDALKRAVQTRVEAVRKLFSDLPGKIKSGLGNVATLLTSAGKDLIRGLINGIKNMAGKAVSAAKDTVNDAVKGAKNLLGISSPSKVFKEIGEQTGQGLVLGIEAQRRNARRAFEGLVDPPKAPTVRPAGSHTARGASGSGTVINITINGAVDPLSTARQIEGILDDRRALLGRPA